MNYNKAMERRTWCLPPRSSLFTYGSFPETGGPREGMKPSLSAGQDQGRNNACGAEHPPGSLKHFGLSGGSFGSRSAAEVFI